MKDEDQTLSAIRKTEIRIPVDFFYFEATGIRGVKRVRDF